MKSSSQHRRNAALLAGLLIPVGLRAVIVGPYTPDANTLHL